jgi:hypothetical protein
MALDDFRQVKVGRWTKLSRYRPDVLTDSNYWADEPIEEEE